MKSKTLFIIMETFLKVEVFVSSNALKKCTSINDFSVLNKEWSVKYSGKVSILVSMRKRTAVGC